LRVYPRRTVEALIAIRARGVGPETVNHHVRALRGFARWLVKARRVGSNPIDTLELVNVKVDVRRARRELPTDELRRLFATTRASVRTFRGLNGEGRMMLYFVAATTGFRANALANLTPADFHLDGEQPSVTLAARFNKSRKAKVQPIPLDAVPELKNFIHGKPAGLPLWVGSWARDKRGAEMLRADLADAGIPYVVETSDGPLYADFHALRHSFLTLGGRSGIDLRTLQELAGHSKPELTARYSHRRHDDLSAAVNMLPSLMARAVAPPTDETFSPGNSQFALSLLDNQSTYVTLGVHPVTQAAEGGEELEMKKPPISQGFPTIPSEIAQRGRRDSNPQPPDRQSRDES
jgi:integrase/recombinase XerC